MIDKPLPGTLVNSAVAEEFGLVSAWLFNDGAGLQAWDSVGGNHGVLTNGPLWAGGGLYCDGSDDYVTGFPSSIFPAGSRTAVVRFRCDSTTRMGLMGTRPSSEATGWVFCIHRTTAGNLTYYKTGGSLLEAAGSIALGKWHIVVVTYDLSSTTAILYVDGNSIGISSSFAAATASGSTGRIGEEGVDCNASFKGIIDIVLTCNKALGPDVISDLTADPFLMYRPSLRFWMFGTTGGVGITVEADPLAIPSAVGSHIITGGATIAATALSGAASVPSQGATGGGAVSASALSTLLAAVAPTVTGGAAMALGSLVLECLAPGAVATGAALAPADALSSLFALPGPTIAGGAVIAPNSLTAQCLLPDSAVTGAALALVDALLAQVGIGSHAATGGAIIMAAPAAADFDLGPHVATGGAALAVDPLMAGFGVGAHLATGGALSTAEALQMLAGLPAAAARGWAEVLADPLAVAYTLGQVMVIVPGAGGLPIIILLNESGRYL